MTKKILTLFLVLLALSSALFIFLILERLTHRATDGFAIMRITHDLPCKAPQETASQNDTVHLQKILAQPFYYFNSGGQSYIFISEDKKYVLKFFKFHHMRIPPILGYLPLPKPLKNYRNSKIAKKNFVLERTFQSYDIAYHHLKKETALIYLHLHRTNNLNCQLHIVDKIGIHFDLNADDFAFALQHKGRLAYDEITDLMNNNDKGPAQRAVSDIIDLVISRCKKGIGDTDPDFKTNFGFISGQAVQLDVGRFHLDESEKNPEVYLPEIHRITKDFSFWIKKNHPDLSSFFDKKIQSLVYESP